MKEFEYDVDKYWFKLSNFCSLCLGGLCFWYAGTGINNGSIQLKAIAASRLDDPGLFWIYFIMVISAGFLFVYQGVEPFILSHLKKLPNKKINKDT